MSKNALRTLPVLVLLLGTGPHLSLQSVPSKQGVVENGKSPAVSNGPQQGVESKIPVVPAVSHPLGKEQPTAEGNSVQDPSDNRIYQVEVTSEPTNVWFKISVYITGGLALVGLGTLIILRRQTNEIGKQVIALMTSERAWIIAAPMHKNPKLHDTASGLENVFGMYIENRGKTAARIDKTALVYAKVPTFDLLPSEPDYFEETVHSGLVMVPSGEPIGRVGYLRPSPSALSLEEIAAINRGEYFLYAYGKIEYRDAFNNPHMTQFGYVYNVPRDGEPEVLRGFIPGGPSAYNQAT